MGSADHHRQYPVRASAASQLSPAQASPLAAQEKNAGKDTSFAQLISSAAPETQKAAQDNRSASKVADDKSAKPAEQTDSRSTAPTTPTGKDTQAVPEKKAHPDTITVSATNAAAASAVASDLADVELLPTEPALIAPPEPQPAPPPMAQPAAPPVPQSVVAIASPIVPAAATTDGSADLDKAEEATAPTATARPEAAPSVAPPVAAVVTVPQAAAPQEPVQPDSGQPESVPPQTQSLAAVSQIAVPKPATPAKPIASTQVAEASENEAAPLSGEAVKPDASKPQTATERSNPDAIKADAAKPDFVPDASADVAAPKPAPQPQAAANTNMAAQGVAPTQTGAPATIPEAVQHVQVTVEAAKPNVAALAVEISAKSQSGAKQFDIRLDPPELGRVEVRLSIDAAGKASAHLSADQPQTLDLLQKDSAVLTRALRDAGLDVSQNSLNFSLRQQAQGQDGGTGRGHGRNARALSLTATRIIEATPASSAIRADGRVDIRV